jgi:hypothetical protein
MITRSTVRIGIAFLLIGVVIYCCSSYWLKTRKLVVLDEPISLSKGHIVSNPFEINFKSGYYIEIEVTKTAHIANIECAVWGCDGNPSLLDARWALSREEKSELSGSAGQINGGSGVTGTVGRKIGYFKSQGGQYQLALDVLSDTNFLNAGNPRLKVEADGDGYNHLGHMREIYFFVPLMFEVVGGALLILARTAH